MNHIKYLFIILILAASCQKNVDIDLDNPPPIPDNIKDSTELIKSISLNVHDALGQPSDDSIKENYFYDTANKKIILTYDHAASHPDYYGFIGVEHSYDNNGLLINVTHKYRAGFTPDDDLLVSVKLDYDADEVLQKMIITNYNGDERSVVFTKTVLSPDKYKLKWTEPLYGLSATGAEEIANVQAIFDKDRKCLSSQYKYSYQTVSGGGLDTYTQIIITDTLIYDASGSIGKVLVNRIDTGRHEEESVVGCEFQSRHTKGDQLYKLQQVLLNGIANIPFGEDFVRGSISGILSYFPNAYEPKQYNKYPIQTARVFDWYTRNYRNFTSAVEFDSKDRLKKFTGFFNDIELFPYVYEINYYK